MPDIIHHTSRRIFSPQYKLEIVNEALAKQLSTAQVAQKHHINNNQVFRWCREYKLGAARWVKVASNHPVIATRDIPEETKFLPISTQLSSNTVTRDTKQQTTNSSTVVVELASGHVIKLTHPTAETIKQILSVII
jgi:transposase-like protein